MKTLPESVSPYNRSPEFTEDTLPEALKNNHLTKNDTWAKIIIEAGEIAYVIETTPQERIVLNPSKPGVVEPDVPASPRSTRGCALVRAISPLATPCS